MTFRLERINMNETEAFSTFAVVTSQIKSTLLTSNVSLIYKCDISANDIIFMLDNVKIYVVEAVHNDGRYDRIYHSVH